MLRMGIVGGGPGSFIGRVHVTAATLDGQAELKAGVFSSNPERNQQAAEDWLVEPSRGYPDVPTMLSAERRLPESERIDFVTVATPNDLHFDFARQTLEAGFHVFCDKPMTTSLEHADQLRQLAASSRRVFVVTHNYTGYPLVRLAREMIANGELGEIQAVRASYLQGWMRTRKPTDDLPRGNWKFDPQRTGPAGTWGDVGVHAFNLIRYVTRLRPQRIRCQLAAFSEGGRLDDAGFGVIDAENGALITIACSQVSHGHGNDLSIEIDGTKASLSWRQESPNVLLLRQNGQPVRQLTRDPNAVYAGAALPANCRVPAGLPEGFFQAFANLYRSGFAAIRQADEGGEIEHHEAEFPTVQDGWEGVKFITASVASHACGGDWQPWSE